MQLVMNNDHFEISNRVVSIIMYDNVRVTCERMTWENRKPPISETSPKPSP